MKSAGLAFAIAGDQKWIASEERVARNRFSAFDAFQQECVRPILFEFQEGGTGVRKSAITDL